MSKKKNKTAVDPISNKAVPPKQYPINSILLMSGDTIKVKKVLEVYNDAYRIVDSEDNEVLLVFFHAIQWVFNGDYDEDEA